MSELKVLFVGPKEGGKSALANFLSDAVQNADNPALAPTRPTVGCRVLEFERTVKRNDQQVKASVEVWDISGDRAYESGWAAARHNALGVVFVYDGDKPGEDKDLEQWHKWFAEPLGLRESQCLVMCHHKGEMTRSFKPPSAKSLSKVHIIQTNLEAKSAVIRDEFDKFLSEVVSASLERREREEQGIIG
mmetsp:Transcript_31022/g.60614  ORF Transcript_31022/g.60614 Transcript_31022/m.60614 type:complete len:190 (+) Transcript_31022:235-804(+)|eukprot:CAMPEP_0173381692 /NCGR_PEP_ID=MMETSP1356-20130122/4098_1 /TAXON_ID=77927 ORGANISM="Hemiselmis virescens, Strain PCC157" /NCGR_SAMPLE_ID=MMETSP1356 /ASSEMBLY_ACC=CAM_ASM_000847 /LENGTH=189 /DNA_ID=CAMNT_0014335631 /DNA_START=199 /DNA_END=768 /DNA_ORIENTATION=-